VSDTDSVCQSLPALAPGTMHYAVRTTRYIQNSEKLENHEILRIKKKLIFNFRKNRDFPVFIKFLKFAFSVHSVRCMRVCVERSTAVRSGKAV